jgi:hypothetical protein
MKLGKIGRYGMISGLSPIAKKASIQAGFVALESIRRNAVKIVAAIS